MTSPEQTETSITLHWDGPLPAQDGDTATFYRLMRDGVLIATPATRIFTDTGLESNHSYEYSVYAVDDADNQSSTAAAGRFSTLPAQDRMPPNPPRNLRSPSQTTSSIQMAWDAPSPAGDGDGASAYNIYRNDSLIKTLTGREYDDVGLTANTIYNYAVYSVDDAENRSLSAAIGTFKTVSVTDIIPPNPPGDLISPSQGETEITLSWSVPPTANDGDTASYYCIMRNGILIGTSVTTSFIDGNLTANTEYRYAVFSVDDADNQSINAVSAVFRTSSFVDTIPPNAPTNMTSPVQTAESITIQWIPSKAAGDGDLASYYRIYRDDALIRTTPSNEFTDTGLQENTSYNYQVFAVDHVGNQSIEAATGIFSTLYIPENEIDSALTAIIVLGQASPWGEKRIPVTLVTTKPVSQVPLPLILQESDGSETIIPIEGLTPGQKFMGILFLDNSVAEGPAFFRLQDRLVKPDGQVGVSTISRGDSVYIDKTPPSNPAILHMRK
jgi:chitodextrinase